MNSYEITHRVVDATLCSIRKCPFQLMILCVLYLKKNPARAWEKNLVGLIKSWNMNDPEIPAEVTKILFKLIRFLISQNLQLFNLTRNLVNLKKIPIIFTDFYILLDFVHILSDIWLNQSSLFSAWQYLF